MNRFPFPIPKPARGRSTLRGVAGLVLIALLLALAWWARSREPGADRPRERRPSNRSRHVELGQPAPADRREEAVFAKPQFVFAYDRDRRVPKWVSWNLNARDFGDAPRHRGKFLIDDSLPAGWPRATHDDYTNSTYDRGHLVRSEERTATPEDNKATFLLTNVIPQTHDLNAGPWLRLEEELQRLAQRDGRELYVVAGGVFGASPRTIGSGVAVPDACFKVVVVLAAGQGLDDVARDTPVISVIMPNTTGVSSEAWARYETTLGEVEAKTRYRLFDAVPDDVHEAWKSKRSAGASRR